MRLSVRAPRVIAVLGPTNTGKTHLAIERMLGHRSGMIGFPLRLLARENYDRVCRLRGTGVAALITGEERIVPPSPRYFLCTVEAMPLDRPVEFLAIDEIQMCADRERGHVFTDRLLHARGREETMLLGAETIAPVVRKLVPDAAFTTRPRMSQLTYAGRKKVTRLPRRSAVIAFSAANVYAMAELIRRQRGGAAVVLGALSPRTRNAQVGMYEAGEVDYLVATDAIGMGLNMAIDHVAFSALGKFDGRAPRRLSAAEIAQIAGRAGRKMADGTFGTTTEVPPLEPQLVEALEAHRFEPLRSVYWRNAELDFHSPTALRSSLTARPPLASLKLARNADDAAALAAVLEDAEVQRCAVGPDAVRLLWDVCRIPDFRKDLSDSHARLVARIFRYLTSSSGVIQADWVKRAIDRLDRVEGDIDTLVARIAHTRTWTYISHRSDWLDDAVGWQEQTRALEDRLSDALHRRLTQRFVDRRTAVLVSRLRLLDAAPVDVSAAGDVVVAGQRVGRIEGFNFVADDMALAEAGPVRAAANRALRDGIAGRVTACEAAPDGDFRLTDDGRLIWQGSAVARLAATAEPLKPGIKMLPSELLDPASAERLRRRLDGWLTGHLRAVLAPLFALQEAPLAGPARGLAFQLVEGLGATTRYGASGQTAVLSRSDRRHLAGLGVRLGVQAIYLPALLRPRPLALRALLSSINTGRPPIAIDGVPPSLRVDDADRPATDYLALGYCAAGPLAVRADVLERVLASVRRFSRQGPFVVTPALRAPLEASVDDFAAVLLACGLATARDGETLTVLGRRKPRGDRPARPTKGNSHDGDEHPRTPRPRRRPRRAPALDPDSPFARLKVLRDPKPPGRP